MKGSRVTTTRAKAKRRPREHAREGERESGSERERERSLKWHCLRAFRCRCRCGSSPPLQYQPGPQENRSQPLHAMTSPLECTSAEIERKRLLYRELADGLLRPPPRPLREQRGHPPTSLLSRKFTAGRSVPIADTGRLCRCTRHNQSLCLRLWGGNVAPHAAIRRGGCSLYPASQRITKRERSVKVAVVQPHRVTVLRVCMCR